MLHFIDDVPTRAKCFVAVAGADAHPHSHVANCEITNTMDARGVFNTIFRDSLGHDPFAFLDGEGLEGFVLEMPNFVPFVVIPDQTFECAVAAAGGVGHLVAKCRNVDGFVAETESDHNCLNRLQRAG